MNVPVKPIDSWSSGGTDLRIFSRNTSTRNGSEFNNCEVCSSKFACQTGLCVFNSLYANWADQVIIQEWYQKGGQFVSVTERGSTSMAA
ncbi:unnamed protein product [Protopolystoma xenopodis]|uniref:Uncharacterized protein n=1 Tax=Protopolystoma xenopodis TaxID=117903 RepID=A0A3S4ZX10_9PLAT|nr:unnamed protein product [Protopolystoma xenopodis]